MTDLCFLIFSYILDIIRAEKSLRIKVKWDKNCRQNTHTL